MISTRGFNENIGVMSTIYLKSSRLELCSAISSQHGAVDGVRVWLLCACLWAGAMRREYVTTLGELLMHRHGLVGDLLINYF